MKPPLAICLLITACGGGGDGPSSEPAEPQYKLARFEFARGHCQFDSERMREVAAARHPDEYAQCNSTYAGNRQPNGRPWPTDQSWPTVPDFHK